MFENVRNKSDREFNYFFICQFLMIYLSLKVTGN